MNKNISETEFKKKVINNIKNELIDAIILKNDPTCVQGIPDISIFYNNKYAMLEFKKNKKSSIRPNQEYYVNRVNKMSFASFIYPENEEEVMYELFKFLLA